MGTFDRVSAVLNEAEAQLKEIVKEALGRGDYSEVAAVTAMAKAIAQLRNTETGDKASSNGAGVAQLDRGESSPRFQRPAESSTAKQKSSDESGYPRFERQGKRLVKLGWSSKDRRVYEQRAPLEAVEEICQRFEERARSRKLLKVEKLLPIKAEGGEEIPSYQVYLVLKWLQQQGLMKKQGKDGYVLTEMDFDFKSLWDKTPAR